MALFMFLLFQTQLIQSIYTVKTFNAITFIKHASDRILDVSYYELGSAEWSRNPVTDLPRCLSNINFKISSLSDFSDIYFTLVLGESSVEWKIPALQKGLNLLAVFQFYQNTKILAFPTL